MIILEESKINFEKAMKVNLNLIDLKLLVPILIATTFSM
jgi:hypothetical protein